MKAVVVMNNGDKCEIRNADQLFAFIGGSVEVFKQIDKGTPSHVASESVLFTVELDDAFVTINRQSISHITWVK